MEGVDGVLVSHERSRIPRVQEMDRDIKGPKVSDFTGPRTFRGGTPLSFRRNSKYFYDRG